MDVAESCFSNNHTLIRMKFVFVDLQKTKPYTPRTPLNAPLGGTQSAICYYISELAKQGHDIILVNGSTAPQEEDGIQIKPSQWYFEQRSYLCDVVVLCAAINKSVYDVLETNFTYQLSIFWHGNYIFELGVQEVEKCLYHLDVFAFVSEYQRNQFCRIYRVPLDKTMLMLNGASTPFHAIVPKKKDTFIYCSHPSRGLHEIPNIWKEIIKVHPRASLEVFSSDKTYGAKEDSEYTLNIFSELRSLPNVTVHDGVGQKTLAEHCGRAAFLLYPTHFVETSCIACIESSAAGVIPIVSDLGVFPEYVDSCVRYCENITMPFAKRANELLDIYYNKRNQFNQLSKDLSTKMRKKHTYATLSSTFLTSCKQFIITKGGAISRLKEFETTFSRDSKLAVYVGESMPLFFESKMKAALFFLWQGNNMMNSPYFNSAEYYFLQSNSIVPSSSACNNLILYYEKTEQHEKLFHWFFTSLKYGFNFFYAKKVLKLLPKLELFEQIAFLSNVELVYKHTTDAEQFLFYVDCMNGLSQRLRAIMQQDRSINLLRNVFQQIIQFPTEPSFKRHVTQVIGSNIMFTANYSKKDEKYMEDCLNYERYNPVLVHPKSVGSCVNSKIRIGFLSGDFVNHPVTYILNGFVEHIDNTKFEVFTFNDRQRASNTNDSFSDTLPYVQNTQIDALSVEECVKVIREKNIDVLVDMCGHTSSSTAKLMDVVRAKPAKVICNYFAYPNTTALKAVDFKLGDETTLPLSSKHLFTEEFQYIKSGLHCYKSPLLTASMKTHRPRITFGVFNNPQKLSIEFMTTVVEIMKKVPDSMLILSYHDYEKKGTQDFYKTTLGSFGIDSSRIHFKVYKTLRELGQVYDDVDISLDTFPYNGGTISIESLHYNTPYVTLLGDDYVSRVGASILKQVKHPELIAETKEEYVQKVIDLAINKSRLTVYHQTLQADIQKSTLEDGKAFATEFEVAIKEMLVKKGFHIPTPITESKRYIICYPAGGIADIFFVINVCFEHALRTGRILVIDTRRVEWFKESIYDFIEFKHPSIYVGTVEEMDTLYDSLSTISTFPKEVKGHLKDFKASYVKNSFPQVSCFNGDPSIITKIDLTKDYEEGVIIFSNCAFNQATRILNHVVFKSNVLQVFRDRMQKLPEFYTAVHIRNTDYTTDVVSFIKANHDEFQQPFFLASDDKNAIDELKRLYGDNVLHFATIGNATQSTGLHYMPRSKDDNRQFIIDSYVDFLMLAFSRKILRATPISGFSKLAEYLMGHSSVLHNLTNHASSESIIQIGKSSENIKVIHLPSSFMSNDKCVLMKHSWNDTFDLKLEQSYLVVTRTDSTSGWGYPHKAVIHKLLPLEVCAHQPVSKQIPSILIQTFKDNLAHSMIYNNTKDFLVKNYNFSYKLITDDVGTQLIRDNFDIKELWAFKQLYFGAAKGDFIRYIALYLYGGVYMDMDSSITINLDDYIQRDDEFIFFLMTT